jgi:peptide/nickel transport system permease protein
MTAAVLTVLRRNRNLRAGSLLLAALLLVSVVSAFTLDDPNRQDLLASYASPGADGHLFGTDALGRDVFAWCAAGVRTALVVSLGVVALSALVGVTVGLVAGYVGGPLDALLMRLVDLQLAIPPLLLFIAVAVVVRGGMLTVILLLSAIGWLPYARIVRTRTVAMRGSAYVDAARLAGVRAPVILVRHLLPQSATLVFVLASLQAGIVLLWESGLSFLGLGLSPPTTSLGFLVSQGRGDLADAWWIVTFPGLTIVLLVLAFNLIGDGLRDRFNVDDAELGR